MPAVLPIVLAALATTSAKPDTGPTLVRQGHPIATIVVPIGCNESTRRAADILRSSVKKMSGADPPIVERAKPGPGPEVDIGFDVPELSKPLKIDGFATGTSNAHLYIRSGGRKGAIYGVVDVLERVFGCRYYSPTAQLFPKRSDLVIPPFMRVDNPVNSFRAVNGDFSRDPDYVDWQRLNSTDEMFGRGYYVHTFRRLIPPETYFSTHPEYFALADGRRTTDQLCPSRPENVEIAVAKLKEEMATQPDKKVWSVSQNDNETYCHCPECLRIIKEEGSPAGPILRFVNAVAKHFPDKTISTLAYEFSRHAPSVTKPDPNVQIMLCSIELDRASPIESNPGAADFRKDVEDWGRIAKDIYLWDYTVNFSHQLSPFPNLSVLAPNIRFFSKNGARDQFQQTNASPGHEFSELKGYLEARLLWDPDADAGRIQADFLKCYYGPAAPWISRYIAALESALAASHTRLDIFERPTVHKADYLSAPNLVLYNRLFDRAESSVAAQPEYLERVKTARLPIEYAQIAIGSDDIFGPRGFFSDAGGRPELKPEIRKTLDAFITTSERNQVRSVNESNLTPRQFYEAAVRLTNLQIQGNLAFRRAVVASPPPDPKYGHGDVSLLTNGVLGGSDFNVQWLGWDGEDFRLDLDLGSATTCHQAAIDTLWAGRSWILHPRRVTCLVSTDGQEFTPVGSQEVEGDQRHEEPIRTFKFDWPPRAIRFVRFEVTGTKALPSWHPSAGGKSWAFVDEIVVN